MFNSFLSSVRGGIQSPKSLLASYLASSLGEVFEVDPTQIESNLLQDTKIVLRSIKLKPIMIHNNQVTVDGIVSHVEFSWTWGGDGTTQFVRDVVLTIRGAKFRVHECIDFVPTSVASMETTVQSLKTPDSKGESDSGYLRRAMDQVLDHLTLHIVDLELVVETPQHDSLLIRSEEIKLITYVQEEQGLTQRISFSQLEALVIDRNNRESVRYPLLDPVSYSAMVTRTSGRRFLDGILTGLHVRGWAIPGEDSTEVTIHLGCVQAQTLSHVVEMLVARTQGKNPVQESTSNFSPTELDTVHATEKRASELILPLPSLSIILPNSNKVHLPNGTLSCRMDGSICELTGTRGIQINDCVPFLDMNQGVKWKIDVVTLTASICYQNPLEDRACDAIPHQIATIVWNETEMKELLSSILDLSEYTSSTVVAELEGAVSREVEAHAGTMLQFNAPGTILLRVQGLNEEVMEAMLLSPSLAVSPSGSLSKVSLGGLVIGPQTSFGLFEVRVPPANLAHGELCFAEPIYVGLDSPAVGSEIGSFLERLINLPPQQSSKQSKMKLEAILPFGISLPILEASFLDGSDLSIELTGLKISNSLKVHVDALSVKDDSGLEVVSQSIAIDMDKGMECYLGNIERIHLPGLATLENPVTGVKLLFRDETLELVTSSIDVRILYEPSNAQSQDVDYRAHSTDRVGLPFPCRLKSDKITFLPSKVVNAHVICHQVNASFIASENSFYVTTQSNMAIRVQEDALSWMEATFDSVDLTGSMKDDGSLVIHTIGMQETVLESSGGLGVCAVIPATSYAGTDIAFTGIVKASMLSLSSVQALQKFLSSILSNSRAEIEPNLGSWDVLCGVSLTVHGAFITVEEPSAITVRISGITLRGNSGYCSSIVCHEESGNATSVSDVDITWGSEIKIHLAQISVLQVSHAFTLLSPTKDVRLILRNGEVSISIGTADITLLPQMSSEAGEHCGKSSFVPSIPVAIRVTLDTVLIKSLVGENTTTTLSQIAVCARPNAPDVFAIASNQNGGTFFDFKVCRVKNPLLECTNFRVSGIALEEKRSIQNFWLSATNSSVVGGVSNLDWSSMFTSGQGQESYACRSISLPFARVAAMSVTISFKGNIVGSSTSAHVPAFAGDDTTTSSDILSHITDSILAKVPSFIANVEFMGESVVDQTAKSVGLLAASTSLTGGAVGSVAGILAVDGIRGAIRSGKSSRGVDSGDGYKFGDFTRGSVRSLAVAAQKGAELRRGESSRYQVGDLTTGVLSSSGMYAKENKSRLGSAGGSGMGMMVGLAVAGPIGLVAGSYLGAKVGRRAFEDESNMSAATKQTSTEGPVNSYSAQDEDLLGLGATELHTSESHNEDTLQTDLFWNSPSATSTAAHTADRRNTTRMADHWSNPINSFVEEHGNGNTNQSSSLCSGPLSQNFTTLDHSMSLSEQTFIPQQDAQAQHHLRKPDPTRSINQSLLPSPSRIDQGQVDHQDLQQGQTGYRFGDLTRSIVSSGKAKAGRKESDGYRFGDFSRGLFGR